MEPTSDDIKRVHARLRRLHCTSGYCPHSAPADRLRRDGAPQWVCNRATELTCDARESRNPLQPRNRGTFEYPTQNVESSRVGLRGSDPGSTRISGKSSCEVGDGCDVCAYRRRTSKCDSDRDDESVRKLVSCTFIQDLLLSVSIQKVVLCHVNGPTRSRGWTSLQSGKRIITLAMLRGPSKL